MREQRLETASAAATDTGAGANQVERKREMFRKLKALGIALVGVFAMSAITASAAHAVTEFEGTEDSTLNGVQLNTHTFIFNKVQITCPSFTATGTLPVSTTQEITLTPTYKNCKVGSHPAIFDFTGCDYMFTGSGEVHLECSSGEHVDIIGTEFGKNICTITVFGGSFLGSKYSNELNGTTGKFDVRVFHSMTGIEYQEHPENGGNCGIGEGKNGEFGGEFTVTATNTAGTQNRDVKVN